MSITVLGITGNRPHKIPNPEKLVPLIKERLDTAMQGFKAQGGMTVIQGGAIGFDQWAALAALKRGLEVKTYVPFPQQPNKWSVEDRGNLPRNPQKLIRSQVFRRKSRQQVLLHA